MTAPAPTSTVPLSITAALGQFAGLPPVANIALLKGGMVNSTYLATLQDGRKLVCQTLHSVLTADILRDNAQVCSALSQLGWPMPVPLLSPSGAPFVEADGKRYRVYDYIAGHMLGQIDEATAHALGALLAKLHSDLAKLTPVLPKPATIAHFHDTAHILSRLRDKEDYFVQYSAEAKQLHGQIMAAWADIAQHEDNTSLQLIHGDARVQNFLAAADGTPLTLIDCDTFMQGSIYVDIGDLLRSLSCDDSATQSQLRPALLEAVLRGYTQASGQAYTRLRSHALTGLKRICIELAARFLNDVHDDCYFGWDNSRYTSRAQNNLARAQGQFAIYQDALKITA
jgi:Ser/Thr protein kinase RdoA (MazF antagonist)